ncbi:MAG: GIY-YIG nuclease family protein [Elusimicrobia bacterium]|nr:GIY-YIG nuclease family protein [Elusimicrobiota bacterium]
MLIEDRRAKEWAFSGARPMPAQTFSIAFSGYWKERNNESVPSISGVYCVYACTSSVQSGKVSISIRELIYIGSDRQDVQACLYTHKKQKDWERRLRHGEELCYAFGAFSSDGLDRCEAALIFKHKPPENTEYVHEFPFDQTTLNLSGQTALLITSFTVYRT